MPWDDLRAEIEAEFRELEDQAQAHVGQVLLARDAWRRARRQRWEPPVKRRARQNTYYAGRRTDPAYRAHKAQLERERYARKVGRPVKRHASPTSRYKRRHDP